MGDVRVSAVMLAYNRAGIVAEVLDRLERQGEVDEIIVVDNGDDGTADAVNARNGGLARAIRPPGGNVGLAGRNAGAREARGEYLLMLDDDSYPLDGAVGLMIDALDSGHVGVVGGFVRNVDREGNVLVDHQVGSFDWWLRAGHEGDPPPGGWPAFFFPEGAALFRREVYLATGGFFEPYFFANSEVDLATRLVGAGWDVRYLPTARFDHLREDAAIGAVSAGVLERRIRNHLWYLALRYPPALAVRRAIGYLAFDLLQCLYNRAPGAWARGILAAWRDRDEVHGHRDPLPRDVIRRAELNRGRRHLALLRYQVARKLLPGRRAPAKPSREAAP